MYSTSGFNTPTEGSRKLVRYAYFGRIHNLWWWKYGNSEEKKLVVWKHTQLLRQGCCQMCTKDLSVTWPGCKIPFGKSISIINHYHMNLGSPNAFPDISNVSMATRIWTGAILYLSFVSTDNLWAWRGVGVDTMISMRT